MLTERGAKGIALLGKADRAYLVASGLVPAAGCPAQGTISVHASNKARAIQTAEVWAANAVPGCDVTVDHPAEAAPDLLFHGLEEAPASFDGHRASAEALALAPAGGLAAEDRRLAPEFDRLEAVLGCARPACQLEAVPTRLLEQPHDRPDVDGAIDVASTASQSLLLEYLEGMPMKDVGWGKATRADIERLLIFHPIKFKYGNRPAYVAKAAAGPIARKILDAFSKADGASVTVLAGHDTNLADLGGLLDLHWRAASYPADDIPPGGAIGFELLADSGGGQFVRAFFRSQTMDQLRELQSLDASNAPFRAYIDIPGCGAANDQTGCTLTAFKSLLTSVLPSGSP
jgi:4-phytase/acid phosphatase